MPTADKAKVKKLVDGWDEKYKYMALEEIGRDIGVVGRTISTWLSRLRAKGKVMEFEKTQEDVFDF